MKLIFHIGLHKTGTTAFQQICYSNRSILRDLGLIYSSYNNVGQHSVLLRTIQSEGIVAFEVYLDNLLSSRSDFTTLLMSGEAFEYVMIDTNLAKQLEHVAKTRGFKTVEWVIVWRDAPAHLRSLYGELSKQSVMADPKILIRAYDERGYFLASSAKFNYGFALDSTRMLPRLKNAVTGSITNIDFADFVKDYPGRVLLQRALSSKDLASFESLANTVVSNPNKALTSFQIEFRYVTAFQGIRRSEMTRVQKIMFVFIYFPLILRRMRNAAKAFEDFGSHSKK